MKKFDVYATFTATKYLGVFEAATEDEAVEIALNSAHNYASLCVECTDHIELDDCTAHSGVAEEVLTSVR